MRSPPPVLLAPWILPLLLSASGCTAVVVNDLLNAPEPCAALGDCAAGFLCVDGTCAPADLPTGPPPAGTAVGPAGGVVDGPDGVTLTVPAGALGTTVQLLITRASSTTIAYGVVDISPFYDVIPSQPLTLPATMTIPTADCATCSLFTPGAADDDNWTPLPVADGIAVSGSVSGLLSRTGRVVAGTPEGD